MFQFTITAGQVAITLGMLSVAGVLLKWHRAYIMFMAEHKLFRLDYIQRHQITEDEFYGRAMLAATVPKRPNGRSKGASA